MVRVAIFDIDGTLIDSVDGHARSWKKILAEYGVQVSFEQVRSQIGKGGDQLMPAFLPAEMIAERGKEIEKRRSQLFKRKYLPKVRPFPQVRALFQRLLADEVTVVLASSAKRDEVEEYKRIANIADLIEAETTSDDAEQSKPEPDIFVAALQKLSRSERKNAIVIGDTPYDAEAAAAAGLKTIGVLCGGFPEQLLRDAGCTAIYGDPADLLARYEDSPLARRT